MKSCFLLTVLVAELVLGSVSHFAAGNEAESPNGKQAADSLGLRVYQLTDVILQHHIDPPTRQQMILKGVEHLYQIEEEPLPKQLSLQISRFSKRDEFVDYLNAVLSKFDDAQGKTSRKNYRAQNYRDGITTRITKLPTEETILAQGILNSLRGGGSLIEAEYDRILEQIRANRYVGIGITLSHNNQTKRPTMPTVFYGGPAWNAGIKAGEEILKIDSEPTQFKSLEEILNELRGEEGSKVTMVVRQPDSEVERSLTLTRSRIFIPTIEGYQKKSAGEWAYRIEGAEEFLFLRINTFGPSTLHELRTIEESLRGTNVRGIVLDLRFGDGMLHQTVLVADALLDGGVIGQVQTVEGVEKYEASRGALFDDIPMAVLVGKVINVDRVFLAAALQDQGRAFVVGETPTNEPLVRSIIEIPGQNMKINLATGVIQRGNGTLLQAEEPSQLAKQRQTVPTPRVWFDFSSKLVGQFGQNEDKTKLSYVLPDYLVSSSQDDLSDRNHDQCLQQAIRVLKRETRRFSQKVTQPKQ